LAERAEPSRGRWLPGAIILLIFLSFFENGLTVLVNVKLRMIGFVILVGLFAAALYRDLLFPGPRLKGFEQAMLAWLGVGCISALTDFRFGLDGSIAYSGIYNLIFEYGWILAYFAGKQAARRGVDFRRVLPWAFGFGAVVTGFAIFEKFFHTYIELFLLATGNAFVRDNFDAIFRRGYGYDESAYRCVSFVLEFIAFSYLCGVLAIAFIVQFMETKRPAFLGGFFLAIIALFLTQSLSSLFACALAILAYLFVIKKMNPTYLIWAGVAAGAIALALTLGGEGKSPFEGIQNRLAGVASGKDEGLVTHFQDFQFGLIDNFTLFGHGLGTADFLHGTLGETLKARGYPTIEHEYFRLIFEVGGVGFLFYAAAVGMTAAAIWRLYRREIDPWRKRVALTCCLWILFYLLVGFAHRSFPTYESSVFPALFLGGLYGGNAPRDMAAVRREAEPARPEPA
jgi:hypothetical protein